jgi:hypothetical protein
MATALQAKYTDPNQYMRDVFALVESSSPEGTGTGDSYVPGYLQPKVQPKQGTTLATELAKYNSLDPSIVPYWAAQIKRYHDYYQTEKGWEPGGKNATLQVASQADKQFAKDAEDGGLDNFAKLAALVAVAYFAGPSVLEAFSASTAATGELTAAQMAEVWTAAGVPMEVAEAEALIAAGGTGIGATTGATALATGAAADAATIAGGGGSTGGVTAAQAAAQTASEQALVNLNNLAMQGQLTADGLTLATNAVAAGTTGSALTNLLTSVGVPAALANTIASLAPAAITALLTTAAAKAGSDRIPNPNVTFGPNSIVKGPDGTTVTLDPAIAASRKAGIDLNNALGQSVIDSNNAIKTATGTYKTGISADQVLNKQAGADYTAAIAPTKKIYSDVQLGYNALGEAEKGGLDRFAGDVSTAQNRYSALGAAEVAGLQGLDTSLKGVDTGLTDLSTTNDAKVAGFASGMRDINGNLIRLVDTENENLARYKTQIGGYQQQLAPLVGTSDANLSTFRNALTPVSGTLDTTLGQYQSLYDQAGGNEGGYIKSVVNPLIQANDFQYGKTKQDFGLRGLGGSSFSSAALGNLATTGGQAVSDATAKAIEASIGIRSGLTTDQVNNAKAQQALAQVGYDAGNTTLTQDQAIIKAQSDLAAQGFSAADKAANTNAGFYRDQAGNLVSVQTAEQAAIAANQRILDAQAANANTLFTGYDTAVKTGLGLTKDSLGAGRDLFDATDKSVNTGATILTGKTSTATADANLADRAFANSQTGITTDSNLLGKTLIADTGIHDANTADVTQVAGLGVNNQNITNATANDAKAILGLGQDQTKIDMTNAAAVNSLQGRAINALGQLLTATTLPLGGSLQATTPQPGPNMYWNGTAWVNN